MTYGTFYTYKNFPVKTTAPYRVPKYEEIPNKYDPFMVSLEMIKTDWQVIL